MTPAQDNGWYVFVSCTSKDLEIAHRIIDTLNKAGIRCWLYKQDIPVGTRHWLDAVRIAIRDACLLIVIVTPETILSEPVHQELTLAFGFGKDILPIWAASDDNDTRSLVWTDFRDYQAEDVRGTCYESGMARLIERIQQIGSGCVRLNLNSDMAATLTADADSLTDELSELGATLPARTQLVREGLLHNLVDKAAVRQYLELRIVRRFEEIYRDNPNRRIALKAFALAFMYGYAQDWIANRLSLSIPQVEAAQDAGLIFLREDTLLVALVRDWLSLKS